MTQKRSVRWHVKVTEELNDKVLYLAEQREKTVSELLRGLVKAAYAKQRSKESVMTKTKSVITPTDYDDNPFADEEKSSLASPREILARVRKGSGAIFDDDAYEGAKPVKPKQTSGPAGTEDIDSWDEE